MKNNSCYCYWKMFLLQNTEKNLKIKIWRNFD